MLRQREQSSRSCTSSPALTASPRLLVVPAGSDLQIIGDGYYSQLTWAGTTTGPVMQLLGPSKTTLRDFSVSGNHNTADGIEVNNADQPGSRVFMEQSNLTSSHTNLFVNGLDYTNVELHDFYHDYDSTTGTTSVNVTGGPSAAPGHGRAARRISSPAPHPETTSAMECRTARMSACGISGTMLARAVPIANITGTSTFTYAGSALYLPPARPLALSRQLPRYGCIPKSQNERQYRYYRQRRNRSDTGSRVGRPVCPRFCNTVQVRGHHRVPERPDDQEPTTRYGHFKTPRAGDSRWIVSDHDA